MPIQTKTGPRSQILPKDVASRTGLLNATIVSASTSKPPLPIHPLTPCRQEAKETSRRSRATSRLLLGLSRTRSRRDSSFTATATESARDDHQKAKINQGRAFSPTSTQFSQLSQLPDSLDANKSRRHVEYVLEAIYQTTVHFSTTHLHLLVSCARTSTTDPSPISATCFVVHSTSTISGLSDAISVPTTTTRSSTEHVGI